MVPYHVPAQNGLALHILQAKLAHVEPPQAGVFLWVRRVVPSVQLVATKHNGLYHVAAFRHLSGETKLLLCRPRQEGEREGGKVKRYKVDKRKGRRGRRQRGKITIIQGRGQVETKSMLRKTSVEATSHEKTKYLKDAG